MCRPACPHAVAGIAQEAVRGLLQLTRAAPLSATGLLLDCTVSLLPASYILLPLVCRVALLPSTGIGLLVVCRVALLPASYILLPLLCRVALLPSTGIGLLVVCRGALLPSAPSLLQSPLPVWAMPLCLVKSPQEVGAPGDSPCLCCCWCACRFPVAIATHLRLHIRGIGVRKTQLHCAASCSSRFGLCGVHMVVYKAEQRRVAHDAPVIVIVDILLLRWSVDHGIHRAQGASHLRLVAW
jgi:hypothetical protein